MNAGFWLALVAGLVWSVGNISHKLLASRFVRSPFFMLVIFSSMALVVGAGMFLFEPQVMDGPDLSMVAVAAVTYLLAIYFYLRAMATEEASRVVPLFAIGTVMIVILGAIFLGEVFSIVQYLGIFFIISGSVIISIQGRLFSFIRSRLLGLMSLAGLFFAVNALLVKKILASHSFVQTFSHLSIIEGMIGLAVAAVLFPQVREVFNRISYRHIFLNAVTDLMGIGAEFIYTMALSLWYLSLVETVASLQYAFIFVWTLVISRFKPSLFMEDISRRVIIQKSISIILIVIGIYLIV
ncbi:DMT family transporter [Patescibacteria group bacterium]|nr:DMT family transporter [Patescibacteria group bacterium]